MLNVHNSSPKRMKIYRLKSDHQMLYVLYILGTNQCASSPCVNGNCINQGESYQCRCKNGYEGKNCDKSKFI